MRLTNTQISEVTSAFFLIGFGILFATNFWWPGIMFVIGVVAIIGGFLKGEGWYALQGGIWAIGIGVWDLLKYNMAVFFVFLGFSVLLSAFIKPPFLDKPHVDNTLE